MGNTLRGAREEKEMSQAQLAKAASVSTRTVIAIEKGERNPTFEVLYPIILALGISADQIFYPDASPLSTEQDQLVREFEKCYERDKRVVIANTRNLIRTLQQEYINDQD